MLQVVVIGTCFVYVDTILKIIRYSCKKYVNCAGNGNDMMTKSWVDTFELQKLIMFLKIVHTHENLSFLWSWDVVSIYMFNTTVSRRMARIDLCWIDLLRLSLQFVETRARIDVAI